MAQLPATSEERRNLYEQACIRFSEKSVMRKFEDLLSKKYIECGVSERTGWITQKGLDLLAKESVGRGVVKQEVDPGANGELKGGKDR